MANVIILVRTSTTKQEVETQKKELLEYAKSDCYSKDDIIIEEVYDDGRRLELKNT